MQLLTSPFAYIAPKESSILSANAEQAQEGLVPSDCDTWGSPSDEGRVVAHHQMGDARWFSKNLFSDLR